MLKLKRTNMTHSESGFRGTVLLLRCFRALAPTLLWIGLTVATAQADIVLNGSTCIDASCSSPPIIGIPPYSLSDGPVPFSYSYPATDGDTYSLAGQYGASYIGGIELFYVDMSATYTGTSPSIAADTFTVDVLQDFYDNTGGPYATFAGTF